jgi:hypothetical protein
MRKGFKACASKHREARPRALYDKFSSKRRANAATIAEQLDVVL